MNCFYLRTGLLFISAKIEESVNNFLPSKIHDQPQIKFIVHDNFLLEGHSVTDRQVLSGKEIIGFFKGIQNLFQLAVIRIIL